MIFHITTSQVSWHEQNYAPFFRFGIIGKIDFCRIWTVVKIFINKIGPGDTTGLLPVCYHTLDSNSSLYTRIRFCHLFNVSYVVPYQRQHQAFKVMTYVTRKYNILHDMCKECMFFGFSMVIFIWWLLVDSCDSFIYSPHEFLSVITVVGMINTGILRLFHSLSAQQLRQENCVASGLCKMTVSVLSKNSHWSCQFKIYCNLGNPTL